MFRSTLVREPFNSDTAPVIPCHDVLLVCLGVEVLGDEYETVRILFDLFISCNHVFYYRLQRAEICAETNRDRLEKSTVLFVIVVLLVVLHVLLFFLFVSLSFLFLQIILLGMLVLFSK